MVLCRRKWQYKGCLGFWEAPIHPSVCGTVRAKKEFKRLPGKVGRLKERCSVIIDIRMAEGVTRRARNLPSDPHSAWFGPVTPIFVALICAHWLREQAPCFPYMPLQCNTKQKTSHRRHKRWPTPEESTPWYTGDSLAAVWDQGLHSCFRAGRVMVRKKRRPPFTYQFSKTEHIAQLDPNISSHVQWGGGSGNEPQMRVCSSYQRGLADLRITQWSGTQWVGKG